MNLMDIICRAEKTTMVSPSGNTKILCCEGWCGRWVVAAHQYRATGWLLHDRGGLFGGMERVANALDKDLRLEESRELRSILTQVAA